METIDNKLIDTLNVRLGETIIAQPLKLQIGAHHWHSRLGQYMHI